MPCATLPRDIHFDRSLRLMGLAAFAAMASMRWCDALLPALAAEFEITPGRASRVVAVFAVAYGAMQLVVGPLGDRMDRQRLVSWAALACMLTSVATALAPSLDGLMLARALAGASAAAIVPMTMAWIGDRVPGEHRSAVLARLLGATVGGTITGQWLGGVFADSVGWRAGFVMVALVFGAAGLVLHRSLSRPPASAQVRPGVVAAGLVAPVWTVLRSADARRLMAMALLDGLLAFGALPFVANHLHARFGLSLSATGAIVALYGLGGLVYSRTAARLIARLGRPGMARAGGLLTGGAWLMLAWWPDWRLSPLMCGLGGLGSYMLYNLLQNQSTLVAPGSRGTATSLFICALFLGQSLGVTLFSALADGWSAAVVLSVCGPGMVLLGLILARQLGRTPI